MSSAIRIDNPLKFLRQGLRKSMTIHMRQEVYPSEKGKMECLKDFTLPVLVVGGSLDIQWLRQASKLYPPDSKKQQNQSKPKERNN